MKRILCIDDDTATTDWVRIMLRGSHIRSEIVPVKTGSEAFERLMSRNFDLCILEYALPDMTGVQLCTLLRQSGCYVPVMLFTAMNRPVDRERALSARANAFLSKPEDLDIFVPTVERLLKTSSAELSGPRGVVYLAEAA